MPGRAGGLAALPLLLLALVASAVLPPRVTAAGTVTLVGAGDIGVCNSSRDVATARLLDDIPGTIFTTGDNAYPDGTIQQFRDCYGPDWGRHRKRTRPSPGNHEYHTADAAGYFGYFGWRAGPNRRGYYVYERGAWRIYSLNSERLTDRQVEWLKADLEANRSRCSLAYWHQPLFSSGAHGNNPAMREFWRPLYRAGAELVINGHDHNYERFAPQRPNGSRSWRGMRQFVVGTGGVGLRDVVDPKPNSVVRQASVHGVLRLRLRDDSYAWRFISVDGSFTDSGSARCHGRP